VTGFRYVGILLMALLLICACDGREDREIALYVAVEGNDTAEGTESKPFATITRARDAVRELKVAGMLDRPVTVYIRDGVHELAETVVFTPDDSGTETTPIAYRAYPGEEPVISGGSPIEGVWREAAGGIMVCDIPAVREGMRFRQLFLGDERQQRSREPDGENYVIAETDEETGRQGMHYQDDHFQQWESITDVEVVVYHFWNESRCRVASLDTGKKQVTFTGKVGGRGIGRSDYMNRYYIENARELIDEPGEWYLDTQAGELYYLPAAGADLTALYAPRLRELLCLQGDRENGAYVEHLTFSGITFRLTDWDLPDEGYPSCGDVGDIVPPSAITFDGAAHCVFEHNTIRNTGTYGLEITGHDNLITDNHIHDTGSGGLITRSYTGVRNRIVYNHIHDCGNVYVSAVGVNVDDGGGYIAHNLIHDTTHTGVYGRHWATTGQDRERRNQQQGLVIEFNEIHDCMHDMNDGAGIFIRDSDIYINNNLIYDIWASPVGHGSPGFGFYLGCETRNSVVKNNVIIRAKAGQLIWFSNRNNLVTNNIFADCGDVRAQISFSNTTDRQHDYVRIFRNIIAYDNPDVTFYQCAHDRSIPVESDYNILWNNGGGFPITGVTGVDDLADWKRKGYEKNSIVADPLFTDPANDDYSLRPDSPAFDLEFVPIDLSTVGLRGRQ
jgi:hypothetical protein